MNNPHFFVKICSNCGKDINKHNLDEILKCLIYHKGTKEGEDIT